MRAIAVIHENEQNEINQEFIRSLSKYVKIEKLRDFESFKEVISNQDANLVMLRLT